MKSSNSQIEQLKLLLRLEEKRAGLHDQLAGLDAKIKGIARQLVPGGAAAKVARPTAALTAAVAAPRATSVRTSGKSSKSGRAGRGELKSRIFSALETAGSQGVKVLNLARSLGTNPANIYAWFHAAVKRYPQIKKVGTAEYRLGGGAQKSKPSAGRSQAKVAGKAGRPARASKPAKAASSGGTRRGALQEKIVASLRSAGARGITVKALSEKLRMPYRNVQVWFATTGKKDSGIKKIAPATYRYAG